MFKEPDLLYGGLTVGRGVADWTVGKLKVFFFFWRWTERRCQMLAAVSENSPKSLVLSIKTSITDYSHKNIPSAC